MMDWLSSNTYSMGSSIVMMCRFELALMCSIIAASVVDLPQPVVPATRTMPRGACAIFCTVAGRPSSSKLGTLVLTKRMARQDWPRC